MDPTSSAIRFLPVLLALLATALQAAQPVQRDVPYVPTSQATVEAMLRLANVGPKDFLIDLGSGDGRIVITAARLHGTRGFGVDIDPERVKESIENARSAGVADRAAFHQRNLFGTDLSKATVITMYLLPRINLELRPKLLGLKPGTRIVSHDFDMGDWQPDLRSTVRGVGSEILFWVVPARVAGRWRGQFSNSLGQHAFEVDFKQKYQEIEGVARGLDRPVIVLEPRIDGDRIEFTLVDVKDREHRYRFDGTVRGDAVEGTVRGYATLPHDEQKWRAVRAKP